MARIGGAELSRNWRFDGVDILRHVAAKEPPPARTLFWRQRPGERTWRAVREGSIKYVAEPQRSAVKEYLFNLETDPGEKQNLLPTRTPDAERLKAKLAAWETEVKPAR